jgi:hypothetical protein
VRPSGRVFLWRQTSHGYIRTGANRYRESALGASLRRIALCEVAKIGTDTTVELQKQMPDGKIQMVKVDGFLTNHN